MSEDEQRWDPAEVRLRVARDLRAIVEMYDALPTEAAERGNPTGEAVMLLGPAANLEAWEHRYERAEATGTDTGYVFDQTGELHPLLLLATWEEAVRDERGQPADLRATVESAARYLRDSLDWMLSDDDNGDLRFLGIDQLADEVHRCRAMLEALLHEGVREDRGVPCLRCGRALVKVWGVDADADRWHCSNRECGVQVVHGDDLNLAVKSTARPYAEWLTAKDMAEEYRVPASTVRRWASGDDATVRKKRDQHLGLMVYRVVDVLARRDTPGEAG